MSKWMPSPGAANAVRKLKAPALPYKMNAEHFLTESKAHLEDFGGATHVFEQSCRKVFNARASVQLS